jgi:3-deoxy-D-manno-octulosonic-acid transferase
MRRIYNTLLLPLRTLAFAWGGLQLPGPRRAEWGERLARRLPAPSRRGGVWLHAASVGEARIAGELARGLGRRRPGLARHVSAYTRTGRRELPLPPAVDSAFFAPLDFAGLPGRVLQALAPSLLVLVETELWPNLLHEARRASVGAVVINGRLSPQRMKTYRRLAALYRPALRALDAVGAQSAADAARFRELGVDARLIRVTGNVKYDLPSAAADPAAVRVEHGLPKDALLFVAGSTARGEDAAVLQAFASARAAFPGLVLVLAPRHPERSEEVERLAREADFCVRRLSSRSADAAAADVVLVDSIGPLRRLYAAASVSFVGGSLVPAGGHNVMEPLAAGSPVLYGPHTESVAEPAAELERRGGALRVRDAAQLGETLAALLADPERASAVTARGREVLLENRGALERTLDLLLERLDGAAGGALAGSP